MDEEEEDHPRCFGRSWSRGDPECEDCDEEYDCRDRLRRRRGQIARRPTEEKQNNASLVVGGNIKAVPRFPGEVWWQRILKNMGLGAASRGCIEASLFFEDERTRPIKTPVKKVTSTDDDGEP